MVIHTALKSWRSGTYFLCYHPFRHSISLYSFPVPLKTSEISLPPGVRFSEELGNDCFACGDLNPQGLHLHFTIDKANPEAITATATIQLSAVHQGPPGFIHGGIIATLLDEAMSKLNRPLEVVAMTRHMEVDYLRPVRVDTPLTIKSHHIRRDGKKIFHSAEITDQEGKLLAQGKALFVVIDPALIKRKT
jgi:uncharacterized protein (TIGR00369 family)